MSRHIEMIERLRKYRVRDPDVGIGGEITAAMKQIKKVARKQHRVAGIMATAPKNIQRAVIRAKVRNGVATLTVCNSSDHALVHNWMRLQGRKELGVKRIQIVYGSSNNADLPIRGRGDGGGSGDGVLDDGGAIDRASYHEEWEEAPENSE